MTEKLVKILEKALALMKKSDRWFDYYDESNDENDWDMCVKYRKRAQGLLDAYEILTGKHVNCIICSIREELETL